MTDTTAAPSLKKKKQPLRALTLGKGKAPAAPLASGSPSQPTLPEFDTGAYYSLDDHPTESSSDKLDLSTLLC